MKRLAFFLLLLAAGAAEAQTTAPAPQAGVPSPPAAASSAEAQPPGLEVMYACPGGTDFAAVFSKDGDLATLTVPGQPEIELSRQQAGSGFAYGDSYYELRGRGREATLTAAGRSMRCHAVGRPGEPPRTYEGGGLTITLFPDGIFRLRERRDGGEPVLDLGQWSQEVDGGVRLVLRGGTVARRVFREANGDRLIAENGSELVRASTPDLIEGPLPARRPLPRHAERRPVRRMPDRPDLPGGAERRRTRSRACLDGGNAVAGGPALRPGHRRLRRRRDPHRSLCEPRAAMAPARRWRRAAPRCAAPSGASSRSTASVRRSTTGGSGRPCVSTTTASTPPRPAATR